VIEISDDDEDEMAIVPMSILQPPKRVRLTDASYDSAKRPQIPSNSIHGSPPEGKENAMRASSVRMPYKILKGATTSTGEETDRRDAERGPGRNRGYEEAEEGSGEEAYGCHSQ
jgi:hypothetical protein